MSTQTLAGHQFPTPCNRCGGALYRQLEHCPYCGAFHPLDDDASTRNALHESRPKTLNTLNMSTLHDSFTVPTFSEPDFPGGALHAGLNFAPVASLQTAPSPLVAPDTSLLPVTETGEVVQRAGLRVRHVVVASVAVVAAGLAYVGYALLSESRDLHGNGDQALESAQDARTATGTIARYSPDQAANTGVGAVPGKPISAGAIRSTTQALPAAVPIAIPSTKPATPQFRDAGQALQAARTAFAANDLSAAQAALAAVQLLQPDSSEAQTLAARLKPLTARRDAALLAAQMCADQQSWPCAREHSDEALALDSGSDAAKTILERVIRETGWAPLNSQTASSAKTVRQTTN